MKKHLFIILLISLGLAGCNKDFLETSSTADLTEADLFSSLVGAETLINGIHRATYYFYGAHDKFGQKSIDYALDCLSEDFYPTERGYGWFVAWYQYLEHRNVNSSNTEYVWAYYYDLIQNANLFLQNIDNITVFDSQKAKRDDLKGQALVYRAYSHYMLVQLYADAYKLAGGNSHLGVPIKLDPSDEALPRSTVDEVYKQIKLDLTDALALLNGNPTKRPNVSHINANVANAIAARVALTTGDWSGAVTYARAARVGTSLEKNYNYGFYKASTEWIWGAVLIDEQQTSYASFFSHIDPNFGGYCTLGNHHLISTVVYDFMSPTDVRKASFITTAGKPRVGWKFNSLEEDSWTNDYLYIKAGEMYLIEAEAEANRGNDGLAQDVLFSLISKRDPAYVKSTLTGDALKQHIQMHRRADLWGEGQRFLDIKRLNIPMDRRGLGHTESLWNAASNFPAGDKNLTFLIPKQEIDANPNMVQNPL